MRALCFEVLFHIFSKGITDFEGNTKLLEIFAVLQKTSRQKLKHLRLSDYNLKYSSFSVFGGVF